jgi:hypothetical protein
LNEGTNMSNVTTPAGETNTYRWYNQLWLTLVNFAP